MANRTITSANSIFQLAIAGLYTTPQQLHGYATDDIFSTEALDSAEVLMGVDGVMSAGFVFVPVKQNITLQADSISNDIFDVWYAAQQSQRELYRATGLLVLPAIGRKWTMTNGVLSGYSPAPDIGKTLKPRKFTFTWNGISPANS